jgi:hypothetical protein
VVLDITVMMRSMPRLKRKLVLNSRPRSDFTMPKMRKLVRIMEAADGGLGLDETCQGTLG